MRKVIASVHLAWDSVNDWEDPSQRSEFRCRTCGKSYAITT